MTEALALVAPGTGLRDGLDRVVKAKRGALVVVGDGPDVLGVCSVASWTPSSPRNDWPSCARWTRPSSSPLTPAASPGPTFTSSPTPASPPPRRAPATARPSRWPGRWTCPSSPSARTWASSPCTSATPSTPWRRSRGCSSAAPLQTLERYKVRLDGAATSLTELEVEDVVTVRDVAAMLQRSETVRRVAEQIQTSIVELGVEAHLIRLQLDELLEDVDDDRELVLLDYLPDDKDERLASALAARRAVDR